MDRGMGRLYRLSLLLATLGVLFPRTAVAEDGRALLDLTGLKGGLVVHAGCGEASLTAQLCAGSQYVVHGLDTDAAKITAARKHLIDTGLYGPVSIDRWDGGRLPYVDNLVNLIVVESPADVSEAEILRVLAPRGIALVRREGEWHKIVKPWPDTIDEWTHYFHGPNGNPVANDTLVGPPDRLQWVGGPAWARHHDHMASMTSLVSAAGRLFYILDEGPTASIQLPSQWRLIARDAFNGVILWKRDIERWNTAQYPLKSGPAHLLRRLVAVGDRVYVTLGIDAPVAVLDAADGKTLLTCKDSEYTGEIVVSDGVVFAVADSAPSRLPEWRRQDTFVWANSRRANPGWGWDGQSRRVLAYEAATGRRLWQAESPVAPCSLAVDGDRVVFHDGQCLVCLDRADGRPRWKGEPTPAALPVPTSTGPRLLIYKDVVLYAGNNGRMSGWSAADGKKLWDQPQRPSGHQSLKDLFVVDGLAWTGAIATNTMDGTFTGYDPLTGKPVREFPADVELHWFHHRCYPSKAAGQYILTARNGTEFVDLRAEHWEAHHWVRGGCIYGVMPCNGLTYAPMNACACQLEAKLTGFNALASGPALPDGLDLSGDARLQRGPAYGKLEPTSADARDWPTYRHDAARSGAASTEVAPQLKAAWETRLSTGLTAPVVAQGVLFTAAMKTHTVYALDALTGKLRWSCTAGGPIDSPPTWHKGLVLFGCADGCVYALRAADGAEAWRFRAAPIDRRMMAWEHLESAWPVHGSVLIHDDVLYCTAGRNMYVDGGLRLIRLDPMTGRLLGETVMNDRDPETGEDMQLTYLKQTQGNNMPVAHSDILSCNGKNIWMRSQKMDFDGKRLEIGLVSVNQQEVDDFHLFCQNGFLDDSYFFRSYWTYGRRVTGGYGGWMQAGRLVPSGRILCVDDRRVYGYGRKPQYMTNASVVEYELFASDKEVSPEAIERINRAERTINLRSNEKNANQSDWLLRSFFENKDLTAVNFHWTLDQPAIVARAMTVAGDTLFIAGPPDLLDERRAFYHPDEPDVQAAVKRQAQALEGREGGRLWALDKADGKVVARYVLDTIPVFDGMAAAAGRLYMTTADGRVLCFGAQGKALKQAGKEPLNSVWDAPRNPGYLVPAPETKDANFDTVARCTVVASKLGYRLRAAGKKEVGLALKKLDEPITGKASFKTRLKAVAAAGMLSNGFLAFGDGADETGLVKCGARLKTQTATIIQGPLLQARATASPIDAPDAKGVDITVLVDLKAQTITYTANGTRIAAPIERPLKSITHVGYVLDSAVIDFADIEIVRMP